MRTMHGTHHVQAKHYLAFLLDAIKDGVEEEFNVLLCYLGGRRCEDFLQYTERDHGSPHEL